jgi:large conductance mechanosensitive channel
MAGMGQEFKAFVMRGNVLDLAVGVIIGAAFGKIVSSFVGDVLMPPIGLLLGGVDFSQLAWILRAAAGDKPAVVLGIGKFIQAIVDFLIIAFAIFLVIKAANRMKREAPAPAPPGPSPTERLLSEIRDLLRPGRQA